MSTIPTRVRKTNRTTGGPSSGKITANVLAKVTAKMQQAIANSGLYVLGYVADMKINDRVGGERKVPCSYLGTAGGVSSQSFARAKHVANATAEA